MDELVRFMWTVDEWIDGWTDRWMLIMNNGYIGGYIDGVVE